MKIKIDKPLSILEALARLSPQSSKNNLKEWIKLERVFIDDALVKNFNCIVQSGQIVSLGIKKIKSKTPYEILYQDEYLICVFKPCGLLSVKSANEDERSLEELLKEQFKEVYAVHRLDKFTSGVMVFALTKPCEALLNKLFEYHKLNRCYVAVIEGKLSQKQGTWQSYLYEDASLFVRSTNDKSKGRLAITHYKVLQESKYNSLVEFNLETGRKNQIRVHTSNFGHPIAGDKKYGAKTDPLKRLLLHAKLLGFEHPVTKKPLEFSYDAPKEFYSL
jgi:23S rRNA pseudouridine1911/1915/1917 synthase